MEKVNLTYPEYLATPHWKELSTRFKKEHPRCEVCEVHYNLHVHHTMYMIDGKCIWFYEPDDILRTLCQRCHAKIHYYKRLEEFVKILPISEARKYIIMGQLDAPENFKPHEGMINGLKAQNESEPKSWKLQMVKAPFNFSILRYFGFNIRHVNGNSQIRISIRNRGLSNDVIDVYPKGRRYHVVNTGERGPIYEKQDILEFVWKHFFKTAKLEDFLPT